MLDKMEIYPYQRVADNPVNNSRMKRKKITEPLIQWSSKGQAFFQRELRGSLSALVNWENIIMALGLLILARAFVLGDLLPFVFAYMVAFSQRDKGRTILFMLSAVAGLSLVLNGFQLWSNVLTLLVLVGVLNYSRIPAEKGWWMKPVLTLSLIFVVKSLLLFFQEISLYEEMVIIFEAIIAGVLCFVFLVGNEAIQQKKPLVTLNFEEFASFLVLGIGLVMGLSEVHLAGLSIGSIICRLGILIAALVWGSGGGTVVGVMTGIIPSITSSIFAQTLGMYAVSGLLAGLFRNFGRIGIIIGFMLGNLALSMFIPETQATILGIWETAIASIIFFLLPSSLQEKIPVQVLGPVSSSDIDKRNGVIDEHIEAAARNRMGCLAGVFEELSSTFAGEMEAKKKNHKSAYLNYLYEQISHIFCEKCSRYDSCWGHECYHTSQQILDLFSMVENSGELTYEKCPQEFKLRCMHAREMINTINFLFDRLLLNEYWTDKLEESRELVAKQLKGVSQVIKGLARELDVKAEFDLELRERLLKEAKNQGLKIRELTPLRSSSGQLSLKLLADACREGQLCQSTIAPAFSVILGENLEVCEKSCPRFRSRGQCRFTMSRSISYKITSGIVQVAKEDVCGDSFTLAALKEGKELIALSDGMGVGEKACSESQATVRLLENLLNSGFERDVALNTINSVLLLRSKTDSFATLDMVMIDLYTGEADFIKVGSAPSFVKRNRRVGMISSNSLPIGILENIDVVTEKRVLCPQDILVMVSDGILEVSRQLNENWIIDFLSQVDENDPQLLAEMIINKALGMCKGQPNDDMTVICLHVDLA